MAFGMQLVSKILLKRNKRMIRRPDETPSWPCGKPSNRQLIRKDWKSIQSENNAILPSWMERRDVRSANALLLADHPSATPGLVRAVPSDRTPRGDVDRVR
jgi:hypothetical protein